MAGTEYKTDIWSPDNWY